MSMCKSSSSELRFLEEVAGLVVEEWLMMTSSTVLTTGGGLEVWISL